MEPVLCPICEVSCRIELNGTLISHPSESTCALSGRTFPRVLVGEPNKKRPTWPEVMEKYKNQSGLPDVDTPELPVRAEASPPEMPAFPAPPPVMPGAPTE